MSLVSRPHSYYILVQKIDVAPDPRRRDALRRLLVHICQQADVLPRFLQLSADEVTLPRGAAYDSESTGAEPTGEGSYARVYEGRMNVKGQNKKSVVAIKSLKFVAGHTEQDRRVRKQASNPIESFNLDVVSFTMITANVHGDRPHLDSATQAHHSPPWNLALLRTCLTRHSVDVKWYRSRLSHEAEDAGKPDGNYS